MNRARVDARGRIQGFANVLDTAFVADHIQNTHSVSFGAPVGSMTTVVIIESNGTKHTVEAAPGTSLMRAALDSSIPGILGDCGGNLACATCHCYVDDAWAPRVPPASTMEREMLECATGELHPNSRLGCQIELTSDLDGLVVRLPEAQ